MTWFAVQCLPRAQPRPRAVMGFGGHARIAGFGHAHPVTQFKESVRQAALKAFVVPGQPWTPLTCPLKVELVFLFPRPGRLIWKKRAMPRAPHVSAPDCDNLAKAVLDAMNGVIFRDDGQIADLRITKWYCAGDETPGVEVAIDEIAQLTEG